MSSNTDQPTMARAGSMSVAAGPDHTLQRSAGLRTQASSPRLPRWSNPVQPGTVSPVFHPAPSSPSIYPFPAFDHELTASSTQTSTSSRSDAEILEHDDALSSLSDDSLLSGSSLLGNTSSHSPPRSSLQDDTVAGASPLEAAPPVLRSPFPQLPRRQPAFGQSLLTQPALGQIGLRQPVLSQPPTVPRQPFAMPHNFQPWMPQNPGYQPPMVPGQPEMPRNIQPVAPFQAVKGFSLLQGIVPKSPQSSSHPPRPTLDPVRRALLRARAIRDARTDLEGIDSKVEQLRVMADVRAPRKRSLDRILDEDEDEKEEEEKSKKARKG